MSEFFNFFFWTHTQYGRQRFARTICCISNTLQHTATHYTASPCCDILHCSTLQHTATHCNTLQHTATHCNTLQHTATRYIPSLKRLLAVSVAFAEKDVRATPYCVILHCNTLPHYAATRCNTLQHAATHCHITLQHTAYPAWEFCSQCPLHSQREMCANASDCHAPSCARLNGCGVRGCGVRVATLAHRRSRGDLYIHFI